VLLLATDNQDEARDFIKTDYQSNPGQSTKFTHVNEAGDCKNHDARRRNSREKENVVDANGEQGPQRYRGEENIDAENKEVFFRTDIGSGGRMANSGASRSQVRGMSRASSTNCWVSRSTERRRSSG
jgi:hypothetical protein